MSASFAQHSREDAWRACDIECNACKSMPHNYCEDRWAGAVEKGDKVMQCIQAYICHMMRKVQCHVHGFKEDSFGSKKKGSVPFKQPRENTVVMNKMAASGQGGDLDIEASLTDRTVDRLADRLADRLVDRLVDRLADRLADRLVD